MSHINKLNQQRLGQHINQTIYIYIYKYIRIYICINMFHAWNDRVIDRYADSANSHLIVQSIMELQEQKLKAIEQIDSVPKTTLLRLTPLLCWSCVYGRVRFPLIPWVVATALVMMMMLNALTTASNSKKNAIPPFPDDSRRREVSL